MTYHAKLIKGGKIVIPAGIRKELGLSDGDSLAVDIEGDRIVLKSQDTMLRELRDKVKSGLKRPLTMDIYLKGKWAEADNE